MKKNLYVVLLAVLVSGPILGSGHVARMGADGARSGLADAAAAFRPSGASRALELIEQQKRMRSELPKRIDPASYHSDFARESNASTSRVPRDALGSMPSFDNRIDWHRIMSQAPEAGGGASSVGQASEVGRASSMDQGGSINRKLFRRASADQEGRASFFGGRNSGAFRSTPIALAPYKPNMTRAEAMQIFGLKDNATSDDIKEALLKKVKEAHPDMGGSRDDTLNVLKAREVLLSQAGTSTSSQDTSTSGQSATGNNGMSAAIDQFLRYTNISYGTIGLTFEYVTGHDIDTYCNKLKTEIDKIDNQAQKEQGLKEIDELWGVLHKELEKYKTKEFNKPIRGSLQYYAQNFASAIAKGNLKKFEDLLKEVYLGKKEHQAYFHFNLRKLLDVFLQNIILPTDIRAVGSGTNLLNLFNKQDSKHYAMLQALRATLLKAQEVGRGSKEYDELLTQVNSKIKEYGFLTQGLYHFIRK